MNKLSDVDEGQNPSRGGSADEGPVMQAEVTPIAHRAHALKRYETPPQSVVIARGGNGGPSRMTARGTFKAID